MPPDSGVDWLLHPGGDFSRGTSFTVVREAEIVVMLQYSEMDEQRERGAWVTRG